MRASNSLPAPAPATCRPPFPALFPGWSDAPPHRPCACLRRNVARRTARQATFASPKSRILACPRLVTKMLAGLMSRWMIPSACAASSASAISMASDRISLGLHAVARNTVLQGHAVQKLHGDEGLTIVLADFVDGADVGMVQGGSGLASRWKRARACGSLATSSGRNFRATKRRASCPRPCRRRPSRRRPASRRCGSARWFGRSWTEILWTEILGLAVGQVNDDWELGDVSEQCLVSTSPFRSS